MVPALLVMQSVPVEAALIPAGLPQETLTWPNRQVALHHDLLLSVPSLHLCEALLLQMWQGVGHLSPALMVPIRADGLTCADNVLKGRD